MTNSKELYNNEDCNNTEDCDPNTDYPKPSQREQPAVKIRVMVNGALGRMGQEAIKAISAHPRLELVGQSDMGDDLEQKIHENQPDVVVDFTTAAAGLTNAATIIESGARPVIGTSGFTDQEVAKLSEILDQQNTKQKTEQEKSRAGARSAKCEQEAIKLGGIIAPNFSLGAVLMMKCASIIAKFIHPCEIVEFHHDRKADAPSGTALRTAQLILKSYAAKAPESNTSKVEEHEIVAGCRGGRVANIPVHSVRLPGYIAHQEVIFGALGETLTIRHDSISRECFMPGVCLACVKVMELDRLVFGLEHVMDL